MTSSHDRAEALADLLRRANSGDAGAYRQFLDRLVPFIRSVAQRSIMRIGAPSADLEDAVQEALLAIHLKRHTWQSDLPIAPWLHAIIRYKLIDFARRYGRRMEIDFDDTMDFAAPEDNDHDLSDKDLSRLMQTLSDTQRQVVTSISIHGASVREVAKAMNLTEVTVRVTLHRSLKALAEAYRRISA